MKNIDTINVAPEKNEKREKTKGSDNRATT